MVAVVFKLTLEVCTKFIQGETPWFSGNIQLFVERSGLNPNSAGLCQNT